MTTLPELLRDADPLAHEPRRTDDDRQRSREAVLHLPDVAGEMPRRRVLTPVFVAAAVVAVAAGGLYWSRAAVDVLAAVRFEVRLAEQSFSPGLREATVGGDGRKIYLHEETVVTNSDIAQATLVENGSVFGVSVVFKDEGARKMRRATQDHIDRPVAILIDGTVVMAPVVRSAIGGEAYINGDFTKAEAERIVAGIVGR